jgi:hypothetical protein
MVVAPARSARPSRELLLDALREGYDGPAWHGPTLRQALRGLTASDAAWRPAPERPSTWDIVLHATYTRHAMLHRLDPTLTDRFPRRMRSNWWPRLPDELTAATWRADLSLLREYHQRLLHAISTTSAARLATRRTGKARTLAQEVLGVAFHDVYHAGQIRLITRLRE